MVNTEYQKLPSAAALRAATAAQRGSAWVAAACWALAETVARVEISGIVHTGSGEMGNWGVHVLDDVRNTVFQDKVKMPTKIAGGGGRLVWNDAGETPNIQFAYFDAGGVPVVMALCNLAESPGSKNSPDRPGQLRT